MLDLGGVFDVYPTPSTVIRVEAGDSMIRFNRDNQPTTWTHNPQISVGAGWRF